MQHLLPVLGSVRVAPSHYHEVRCDVRVHRRCLWGGFSGLGEGLASFGAWASAYARGPSPRGARRWRALMP